MTHTAPNRETWLNTITALYIRPHFQAKGYSIPDNIRMSCSLTGRKKAIGIIYSSEASEDSTHEIFISPTISDSSRVVDILIHELAHAVVGLHNGHNKTFGKCVNAVGLTGKLTATTASEELKQTIAQWLTVVGEYPHATLSNSGIKKQGTRLIKCECASCGYTVRLAKKWLDIGSPRCPNTDCLNYDYDMTADTGEND